ncbi:MAG: sulfotransferase domain-containing protein [Wenzhouxiangella sp.]
MVVSIDRGLHWAILVLTAPFPRGIRVRLRYRLLKRLQLRLLDRASLLMIRHPKTGGTWLRTMLTHLYAQHYGIGHRRVFKSDELQRQNAALPRWAITNGLASWERVVAELFQQQSPRLNGKKTLFVARHPGDIVVSWYIQYTKRTKAFKRELLEWEATRPIDRDTISREAFIRHPDFGLPWLIRYHNFWAAMLKDRPDALIIRYEDLRLDTANTLARIAEFIDEPFSAEEIAATVEFTDFDNMRKLEKDNYFQNNSLKLRNPDDPEMRKVRRAQVGAFRDDLDGELLAWIDRTLSEELDPVFGYGPLSEASGRRASA